VSTPSENSPLCNAYHHAVELIGRRWTGLILQVLLGGARRFSDISAAIPGLTDRMLSERLKELEAERIVTRTVIPETPVRVEYQLTERGHALGPVLEAIGTWAQCWLADPLEPPEALPARQDHRDSRSLI
jgi:DNA-binding HxlR family transcriptional regulator